MNHFLHGVARAIAETFDFPEPIVEIGSFQVAGQEEIAELRGMFPGKEFLGIDMRPGPGVDHVADAQDLPFADGSIGTVLALNTFEHVPRFWRAFDEVRRVLRPNGAFLVSVPFHFHIHSYPSDYWRFTPEALDLLLEDYPQRLLGWHGPEKRPANVWALALGEGHAPISEEVFAQYQARVRSYARESLGWTRRLRYLLGRWLCGRRPFAPFLDHERWNSECRNRPSPWNPPISPRRRSSQADPASRPACAAPAPVPGAGSS